jgi:predicted phosphodiesterase
VTTRIAIFSDPHGNSAATEAVLAAIAAEAPDAVYCLGDLVGYGAMPNETIALIRERGIPTTMGNYDDGVGFDRDDCGCAYIEGVLFVNDGSVGKPKVGDPRAAWALLTVVANQPVQVEIRRGPYDVAAMAAAIRAAEGLPDHFARDIETGGHH